MTINRKLLMRVEQLQHLLVARATGEGGEDADYRALREELLAVKQLEPLLPRFVESCRDLGQFWGFIKSKFGRYQERRAYLWDQFRPALQAAEKGLGSPAQAVAAEALQKLDAAHVHEYWSKAIDRLQKDPEGALTSARTLLESVCKLILEDLGEKYDATADLPKLYKQASKSLNLAPEQHVEPVFKQILGGCASVVEGLGSLRNKLGDAHGQGKKRMKALPRHAQLAVNLAGAMSTFLVETYEARHGATPG
jgi:hypothetical protein